MELTLRKENVLLVDDNELLLHSMKRLFAREFRYVNAVSTGEDAIARVQYEFYHIIVLDINLPRMDGWEVLARIMHHSPTSRVVIVTACEDKAIRQKAIEEGAVELIGKPFNLRELKDVITKILSYCERNRRIGRSFEVLLGDQYRGQTYNLSMSGMLVLSNVSFDPGTTIGLTVQINTQEQIPLKGQVVRIVDWMSPAVPHRSGGINIPGPATYGLGIKLTEQFPAYSSFINSLMT